MIFGGNGKDVAHSDYGSFRGTLPGGGHGSGDVRTVARAGAAGTDLRGLRPTARHQATSLLATRSADDRSRHPDPQLGPLRLSPRVRPRQMPCSPGSRLTHATTLRIKVCDQAERDYSI